MDFFKIIALTKNKMQFPHRNKNKVEKKNEKVLQNDTKQQLVIVW